MTYEGLPSGATSQDAPANLLYTVTEIYPEHVVLDGNHPLAGIALRLDLQVRGVREATAAEAERGSVGEQPLSVLVAPPSGGGGRHLH